MVFLINSIDHEENNISMSKLLSKNFNLTEDQFNDFLNRTFNGDHVLLKILFEEHFGICTTYLIRHLRIDEEDAMDASMDALLDFWDKILHQKIKYGNLAFLFTKMAFQSYIKSKAREKRLDLRLVKSLATEPNTEYCEQCLLKAFDTLSQTEQTLLFSYYVENITMVEFATKENMKEETIRKRKQRALKDFKAIFYKNFDP